MLTAYGWLYTGLLVHTTAMAYSVDLYRQALEFAAVAHADQMVPGKPYSYVVHLASVAAEVSAATALDRSANADLAVACALLHDTLEDTPADPLQLEMLFGRDVSMGVRALTKDKSLSRRSAMEDSLKRIRGCSREVGMVKLADRIVNLSPPPPRWSAARVREYWLEAQYIHAELASSSQYLSRRIEAKIKEYEKHL